jgi:DNA-binding NarL/FixJ family response regulator
MGKNRKIHDRNKSKRKSKLSFNCRARAIYGDTIPNMYRQGITNVTLIVCDMYGRGVEVSQIAKELGVSRQTVVRYVTERNTPFGWKRDLLSA